MIEFEVLSHGMRMTEKEPSSKRTIALRMVSSHEVVVYLPVSIAQLSEFPLGSKFVLLPAHVELSPAGVETLTERTLRIVDGHK